ncbi:MAG TPA: hypothetical protein VFL76_10240 [Edaphocola sp.]|nr:hypothetical protein [Edaphocola sp.]
MIRLITTIRRKLQKELKNFPFEYSFEDYKKYNQLLEEHFKYFKYINIFYRRNFTLEKEYFKFIILKNSQFVLSLSHYFDNTNKAKEDYQENSFHYKCLNDFWKIFTVITNNYIVLSELLLSGKDYQAKIIFRNTIELSELCICILGDENFYNFFKKKNDVDDPKYMFQTLKFNTIKKITQKVIDAIKQLPNNNLPKEVWDEYLQIRQEFYDDTSRHTHSNFLNLMLGSHVQMIETDIIDVKEMMLHNLGGIINSETKQNLKNVIVYDSLTYMVILILVIENHKLFFSKLDKDVNHLTVLSKFNWDLLSRILK